MLEVRLFSALRPPQDAPQLASPDSMNSGSSISFGSELKAITVDEFHICFRDIPEAFSTGCQFWHRAGGDRLHSNLSRFFRI